MSQLPRVAHIIRAQRSMCETGGWKPPGHRPKPGRQPRAHTTQLASERRRVTLAIRQRPTAPAEVQALSVALEGVASYPLARFFNQRAPHVPSGRIVKVRLACVFVVLAMTAAACGENDASGDEALIRPAGTNTDAVSSTSSSSTTTIAETSSTTAASTTTEPAPASTAPANNPTPPTNPPATGYVDEGASPELEAELIGIVSEIRWIATKAATTNKLPRARFEEFATTRLAQRYSDAVARWVEADEIGALPPGSVAGSEVRLMLVDGGFAAAEECVADDMIVTNAETGAVIDDSVGYRINEWQLQETASGWRASEVVTVLEGQAAIASDRCAF
jgi:hypothetical protein